MCVNFASITNHLDGRYLNIPLLYFSNAGSHLISAPLEHLKLALMKCIRPRSQLQAVNSTQVTLIEWCSPSGADYNKRIAPHTHSCKRTQFATCFIVFASLFLSGCFMVTAWAAANGAARAVLDPLDFLFRPTVGFTGQL